MDDREHPDEGMRYSKKPVDDYPRAETGQVAAAIAWAFEHGGVRSSTQELTDFLDTVQGTQRRAGLAFNREEVEAALRRETSPGDEFIVAVVPLRVMPEAACVITPFTLSPKQ